MSEYDLKKSEKIGQLYPVLVDAKGNIIDGFHRLEADPKWRTEKLKEIDTKEKLLVARCVANWHRRQVSWEEKKEWINGLARIYKKQGLRVCGHDNRNEILEKVVEVTGLSKRTVQRFIRDEFKHMEMAREQHKPKVSASQAIITYAKGATGDEKYGKQLVERHRREVELELRSKIDKEIREKIIDEEIKPKVKEELSRDVEFIREAIEKAPEVLPTLPERTVERAKRLVEQKEMVVKEGTIYTVGEYECPHCKRHYWIRCNGKRDWVE